MVLSGQSPDGRLVEIVELRDHPWFVASQFHPEFKSRPERPHPLFDGFVAAALAVRDGREPVLEPRVGGRPRRRVAVAAEAGGSTDRAHADPAVRRDPAHHERSTSTGIRRPDDRVHRHRRPEPAPMKIFLDTADIDEIRTAARWGVLDGVTTNPTLYAKVGGAPTTTILQEICRITAGPGVGRGHRRRRRGDARPRAATSPSSPPNIVVKVPMSENGLEAISRFADEGIRTNCTLIFTRQPGPPRGEGRARSSSRPSSVGSTTSTRTA